MGRVYPPWVTARRRCLSSSESFGTLMKIYMPRCWKAGHGWFPLGYTTDDPTYVDLFLVKTRMGNQGFCWIQWFSVGGQRVSTFGQSPTSQNGRWVIWYEHIWRTMNNKLASVQSNNSWDSTIETWIQSPKNRLVKGTTSDCRWELAPQDIYLCVWDSFKPAPS